MKVQTEKKGLSRQLAFMGLCGALCCIATLFIQLPMPSTGGYVNVGDCFVLLTGWLLGPIAGGVSAGIGSMLADLLTGYAHYAPFTLLIKGLMAVCAGGIHFLLTSALARRLQGKGLLLWSAFGRIVSGVIAELWMVAGYFLAAGMFLGKTWAAALESVPGNLLQGVIGLILGVGIAMTLESTGIIRRFFGKDR